jgi:hypothetical protein
MRATRLHVPALIGACFLAVSCAESGSGTSLSEAPMARQADERSQDFGDYVVHYSATTTDLLSPEDAQKYGITRSKSNAMLNVVLLQKTGAAGHTPISGKVSAKTNNLTGQLKNVTLREITEGNAIYYIGVLAVAHEETLNFAITAVPAGTDQRLEIKFQQQFFTR